ncbi:MAG: tetratricopeptide repeat protein [Myxococcota bacterium]
MAIDDPVGKKAARVPVFYFPKRAKAVLARSQTLTLPEFRLDTNEAERVTDPLGVPAVPEASPPSASPSPKPRKGGKKKGKKDGKAAKPRGRELTPTQVAEMSLLGHQLFEMGRLDEARVVFEGLVGLGVKDAFPHTMLGTIYLALDDQERALALFEAALQVDRSDLAALVYRGEIRLNRGKVKPALEDLSRAIELGLGDDPFVERARRLMVMAQEVLKRR